MDPRRYAIEQFPSAETMHGPMGFMGLQTFPNMGHSSDLIMPLRTSPHLHPFASASTSGVFARMSSCTFVASWSANFGRSVSALFLMTGNPRHARSTGMNVSSISFSAAGLPSGRTRRVYSFSTSALPSLSCLQSM